jgi:hypothetical protein
MADSNLPGGVSHVLVSSTAATGGKMHRPHPDDPSRPCCGHTLTNRRGTWQQKDHPRMVVFNDRCGQCPWPDEDGGVGHWACPSEDCGRRLPSKRAMRGHARQCDQATAREAVPDGGENSHASSVAAQLRQASDDDLEEIGVDPDSLDDDTTEDGGDGA